MDSLITVAYYSRILTIEEENGKERSILLGRNI